MSIVFQTSINYRGSRLGHNWYNSDGENGCIKYVSIFNSDSVLSIFDMYNYLRFVQ